MHPVSLAIIRRPGRSPLLPLALSDWCNLDCTVCMLA
jgi:hypothetical protein